jgi:hypothetical protein
MRLGAAQRAKKLASSTMVACGLILPAIAEPFVAIIAKIRNIDADRVSVAIAVFRAKCWLQVDTLRMAVGSRAKRNAFRIAMIILPLAIFGSLWLAGRFDSFIDPYFDKSRLSTLIVTVGGGLVGATAVAFSIVVFSVQINVERTSVVMFQSLSRDRQLILVFVLAVFASVACASLSLFTDAGHIGQVLVGATWAALSVPCLIVFAYFRALKLINPHHQLLVLFKYTNLHLKRWSKRADRLTPWVKQTLNPNFLLSNR